MTKTALVLGAGGFIGHHMVKRLKSEGYWVRGVDLKNPEFESTQADEFVIYDLRNSYYYPSMLNASGNRFDEVYQFAADMGGAGFVFTGENDSEIMHNSCMINLNLLHHLKWGSRIFYASSACVYPARNQTDPNNPNCEESTVYPAEPDSEYGWEKLYSERMYQAYARNHGLDVRIARYHNVYGPLGTWQGGREKAPAAICRKIIEATKNKTGTVEIWGDGEQTRSFLYIDDAIEATRMLMQNDNLASIPVNIGSDEMVTINRLVDVAASVENRKIYVKNVKGPVGVMGRCSDNHLISSHTGWRRMYTLEQGMAITYKWIKRQTELTETASSDKISSLIMKKASGFLSRWR